MTDRLLLRGGCVLTLGAKSANLTQGDVLIEDAVVAEVGRGLRARDAEVIDAAETIVMPGFVDTHRHAAGALFRNAGEAAAPDRVRPHYGPDDVEAGTLIGLLGAAEAGVTTVVDWADVPRDDVGHNAALRAHTRSGLRTVYVVVDPGSSARDLLEGLRAAAGPRTTIALGSHMIGRDDLERVAPGWALARDLGLRIHAHAAAGTGPGIVTALGASGQLGDDVTLVHHTRLDGADLDAIRAAGAAVCLTPSSEMTEGAGAPPIQGLIDRDLHPGLGVGRERWSPGDLFAQIREAISIQHATVFDRKLAGKGALPKLLSTRDVIRWGTVEGARAAGLGGVVGSLEPGMAADLVMLRTDRPNIYPVNDPIGAVVWGMDTSNVDVVVVAGRVLVRGGALEADAAAARASANTARTRVAEAAGLALAGTGGDR